MAAPSIFDISVLAGNVDISSMKTPQMLTDVEAF